MLREKKKREEEKEREKKNEVIVGAWNANTQFICIGIMGKDVLEFQIDLGVE